MSVARRYAGIYDMVRRRMIRETQLALLHGLRFPHRYVRIPTIEVGKEQFAPDVKASFWESVLELGVP